MEHVNKTKHPSLPFRNENYNVWDKKYTGWGEQHIRHCRKIDEWI